MAESHVSLLQLIGGLALIGIVFVDLLQTTVRVSGHGFLSGRLSAAIWRLALGVHRRRRAHRLLESVGPLLIVTLYCLWFALLWCGWTLIFASGDIAVVNSTDRLPASLSSLFYFAGFNIITLGVGDYVPVEGVWQLITIVAAVSGFFLVTMVITYVFPVLSGVVTARQLARSIHGLGRSVQDMLAYCTEQKSIDAFHLQLALLTGQVQLTQQQHLAYPILHYFHTPNRDASLAVAISTLDDLVSALQCSHSPEGHANEAILKPLRSSLDDLLNTLGDGFIRRAESPPPPPEGIVDRAALEAFDRLGERRCILKGWVQDAGFEWQAHVRSPRGA